MPTYQIIRFYRDSDTPNEIIAEGLTREEVQAHCSDPSTSTEEYFDGFEEEYEGEYEGWTNHATWVVNLWVMNDEITYKRWLGLGPFHDEPYLVREFVENHASPSVSFGILSDLWSWESLNDVDWEELLVSWNED